MRMLAALSTSLLFIAPALSIAQNASNSAEPSGIQDPSGGIEVPPQMAILSEAYALRSRDLLDAGQRVEAIAEALKGLPSDPALFSADDFVPARDALRNALRARVVRLPIVGLTAFQYSADGSRLLTSTADPSDLIAERDPLQLWDGVTGEPLATLLPPELSSTEGTAGITAEISADGSLIVGLGTDGTLRAWDPESGTLIEEHAAYDLAGDPDLLTFDPSHDGHWICTVARNDTVDLWSVSEFELIGTFDPGAAGSGVVPPANQSLPDGVEPSAISSSPGVNMAECLIDAEAGLVVALGYQFASGPDITLVNQGYIIRIDDFDDSARFSIAAPGFAVPLFLAYAPNAQLIYAAVGPAIHAFSAESGSFEGRLDLENVSQYGWVIDSEQETLAVLDVIGVTRYFDAATLAPVDTPPMPFDPPIVGVFDLDGNDSSGAWTHGGGPDWPEPPAGYAMLEYARALLPADLLEAVNAESIQ